MSKSEDILSSIRRLKQNKANLITQETKKKEDAQQNKQQPKTPLQNQTKEDQNKGRQVVATGEQDKNKVKEEVIIPTTLFQDMTFCFPIQNKNLTQTRIKMLTNTIQSKGGIVLDVNDMDQYSYPDYVIVGNGISKTKAQEIINNQFQYYKIMNIKFIERSLKQGKIPEQLQQCTAQYKDQKQLKKKNQESLNKQSEKKESENKTKRFDRAQFFCQKGTFHSFTNNKKIGEFLIQISKLYEKTDQKKSITYRVLSSRIKSYNEQILDENDVDKLVQRRIIGIKTKIKIKEFLRTGTVSRICELSNNEETMVREKLSKVWGIGPSKADQLYAKGIKSIQELRHLVQKKQIVLTKNQNIGLKYYQELNQRIPREKVTKMFEFVKQVFFQLVQRDDIHQIQVCGSYRRGRETCGDMDIIITRKDGVFERQLVMNLVKELTSLNFITDHLTQPRHADPSSCISYMGICKYDDEIHHRVDFKYYPQDQYAFAILYFTGSDMFNRQMRLLANTKGYTLSDHGIQKAQKNGMKIIAKGEKITCLTQESIFKLLQMDYKSPEERSI